PSDATVCVCRSIRIRFHKLSDASNGPFFFSSRRRHTRWPRDWSSDVCSSDLLSLTATNGPAGGSVYLLESTNLAIPLAQWKTNRSEERRVGKECRYPWSM